MIYLISGLLFIIALRLKYLIYQEQGLRDLQNTNHVDMTRLLCEQLNKLRDRVDELEKP